MSDPKTALGRVWDATRFALLGATLFATAIAIDLGAVLGWAVADPDSFQQTVATVLDWMDRAAAPALQEQIVQAQAIPADS